MPKQMNHVAYQRKVRDMSVESLRYTIADARETLQEYPDSPNAGYYLDEIAYCSQELSRRSKLKQFLEVDCLVNT